MNKKGFDMMVVVYIGLGLLLLLALGYLIKTGVIGKGKDINRFTECNNLPTGETASCVVNKTVCEDMDGRPLPEGTYGCGGKGNEDNTVCCITET